MAFATTRSVRTVRAAPSASRATTVRPAIRATPRFLMRAQPSQTANSVESAIKDAEEACEGGNTGECAAAWDNVEEISAAISHKKVSEEGSKKDPLDLYCDDNPEADECRVYED